MEVGSLQQIKKKSPSPFNSKSRPLIPRFCVACLMVHHQIKFVRGTLCNLAFPIYHKAVPTGLETLPHHIKPVMLVRARSHNAYSQSVFLILGLWHKVSSQPGARVVFASPTVAPHAEPVFIITHVCPVNSSAVEGTDVAAPLALYIDTMFTDSDLLRMLQSAYLPLRRRDPRPFRTMLNWSREIMAERSGGLHLSLLRNPDARLRTGQKRDSICQSLPRRRVQYHPGLSEKLSIGHRVRNEG